MSEFLDRISRLSPQRLALLADELNRRLEAAEQRRKVPLAIVGIGCRLPGGVEDPEGFWALLSQGVDAVTEVPRSRWNNDDFYDRNSDRPGKMSTRWGGFIGAVDQFDPRFFGIAPAEAASMDPQQRLLLETSWESLEHAGIAPSSLAETATGVFVGICNTDYGQLTLGMSREAITPYSASGLSHAVAAGRISYVLGLQGPCLAVDTSCSASLVAVHLACQSLRLGECETALAGGVNLILSPDITIALSQSKMMAPDGRCKAFSDDASGFVRGEGCGMIVLKRLPDALRDRNRIVAVIRGSATNQDGRSSGLTAPNGPSQEAVLAAALADAGLRPDAVDAIEAHGTGTSLGDPIEAEALNAAFAGRSERLWLGSVKTNIGHLESAAGIAGLIKLVLSVERGKIPASLHLGKPNHRIEWDRLPLTVPTKLETWPRRGKIRVGGVSSFGFSGTNAHVIVEEFRGTVPSPADDGRAFLFPLSARTPAALQSIAGRLHRHLTDHPSLALADIARTLTTGRSHFEFRAAIAASSYAELLEGLRRVESDRKGDGIEIGRSGIRALSVSFLFPGEAIPVDAGRELYERSQVFREAIERCANILGDELDPPLLSVLYPARDSSSSAIEDGISSASRRAAEFALQYALAELWRACGIEPAAMLSSGTGDSVAAHVAGMFSLEDALRLAIGAAERPSSSPDAGSPRASEPRIPLMRSTDAAASELPEMTLVLGANTDRGHFPPANGDLGVGKQLLTLSNAGADRIQFLRSAASLYALGCNLDLSALDAEPANTVSLPTYPFDRERYWLDLAPHTSQKREDSVARTSSAGAQDGTEGWVYNLDWDPKPLAGEARKENAGFDEELLTTLAVSPATPELARVADAMAAAQPLYSAYILEVLEQGGLTPLPRQAFTLAEMAEKLKVLPGRTRILARLLAILVEDKVVENAGGRFRFVDFLPRPDAGREVGKLAVEYPECRTELKVLSRCGSKLLAVLQGTYDPMQLVFADGSVGEAEQIYERSPVCRFFNGRAARAILSAVDPICNRAARILEIGAGTGATTGPVLSALKGKNFEYTFTDVSGVFLARAHAKFAQVPSMVYRLLDIERDPVGQGFEIGTYDVILAANVLHATADLRRTLAHVHKLLAPGGVLLLIEGVASERWLEFTFGLTDGWYRFIDFDLRPEHPLVSVETWTRELADAGLGCCRTVAYALGDGSLSQQRLIISQKDIAAAKPPAVGSADARNWIVFADESGVGDAFHKLVSAAGHGCQLLRRPEGVDHIDTLFRETAARLESSDAPTPNILYLWSLDVPASIGSAAALSFAEEVCARLPIHLIQALLRSGAAGRLAIVTRGAQAAGSFFPSAGGAVQSLAWGVGRVFGLEAAERYRGLIDLDPEMPPEAAAAALFGELSAEDGEDQIAYRGGARLVPRLRHSRLQDPGRGSFPAGLKEDGSYLIVGGLGGVGLQLTRWAAEQRPGHLVLLGRTGIGSSGGSFAAERARAIEEIRSLGVNISVVEGDVACEEDMRRLFDRFGGEFPVLRGVFHAATVVDGTEIADLTDAKIEAMLRSKVAGTWGLHEQAKALPLDFFLVFSSSTSLLGARGMAHYAAACQFQDAFGHFCRAAGFPMISVNWGLWDFLRLVSAGDQRRLGETGLLPMLAERALRFLPDLIASDPGQVMIANIDWSVLKPLLEVSRRRPMLEELSGGNRSGGRNVSLALPSAACLRAAIALPPAERTESVREFVRQQAAHVLGYRAGELPPFETPLPDLGLDSLMAVDLKNRLQTGLGQELSPTIVFDYPTVCDIVGMLETMLWASHDGAEEDLISAREDVIRI